LKQWQIHDLRRVIRTALAGLGTPDHISEMVIGHGRKGMQRVYDQNEYAGPMRDAMERWAHRLREIVNPPRELTSNVLHLHRTATRAIGAAV
jgi:carbonic anhydrase